MINKQPRSDKIGTGFSFFRGIDEVSSALNIKFLFFRVLRLIFIDFLLS